MQGSPTPIAGDYQIPLATLYERFDAMTSGRGKANGVNLHGAILTRLASNRRHAEAAGWTGCTLERDGGSGRLRLIGVAPAASGRTTIPDWTAGEAAGA